MAEPNPSASLFKSKDLITSETLGQVQRRRLGIPNALSGKPILYLSSHRGYLDGRCASHIAIFNQTWKGEREKGNKDEESLYVDLTLTSPDLVVESLREIIMRNDPSRNGEWLPSNTTKNEPLPRFIANIIYLPELNDKGKANEPAHTFAVDPGNARLILGQLKEFLVQKDILVKKSPKSSRLLN